MRKKIVVLLAMFLVLTLTLPSAMAFLPEINLDPAPKGIPDTEAINFLQGLGTGWNLGNTFDANDNFSIRNELDYEKTWCGVITSREMIHTLKEAGFGIIRVPVSWHNHVSGEDFTISPVWLARVHEVVDWIIDEGMYVIINTHHDVSPDYYYPAPQYLESSKKYISSIWSQLAEEFKDYDEHLIFESMNEPRLKDTQYEWNFNDKNFNYTDAADCINQLNQVFVNVVRASGGMNSTRYLMVPGYAATPDAVLSMTFKLPEDTIQNHLIVSVHAYTPYEFALQAGGKKTFNYLLASDTTPIRTFMNALYGRFIRGGIPVIIGEYGARNKDNNLQDRVNFAAYYNAEATRYGFVTCWWDNHAYQGSGELFGILNRYKAEWRFPEIVEAIITYSARQ